MDINNRTNKFVLTIVPPVLDQPHIQKKEVRHVISLATPLPRGTDDYNELLNKPMINGVELINDRSLSDLGIKTQEDIEDLISFMVTPYRYKGTIPTVSDLDLIQDKEDGDIYRTEEDKYGYVWEEQTSSWKLFDGLANPKSLTNEDIDAIIASFE